MQISKINYSLQQYQHNKFNQAHKLHSQRILAGDYFRPVVERQPAFNGLVRSVINSINPFYYLVNSVFKRSVLASRKIFKPIVAALQGKIDDIKIRTADRKLINAWDINPNKCKEYVVFLHGTSVNVTNSQNLYEAIIDTKKFGVFIPEYRGFGRNPKSSVDEYTLIEDAQAAINYLVEKKKINNNSISLVGHSLGGGVAAATARRNPELKQVVLIAPINTLKHEVENIKSNKHIKMPKLMKKLI